MNDQIKNFYDLRVWQDAHKLVVDVYKVTSDFPSEEKFGVISQMQRAALCLLFVGASYQLLVTNY